MAKKVTKRKVVKKTISHKSDQKSFLMIVLGGGLLLIIIMALFFNPFKLSSKSSNESMYGKVVVISESGFQPSTIRIKNDEFITWKNNDASDHVVVIKENGNTMDRLYRGGITSYKFETPGTYNFYSQDNPSFKGVVVVE